MNVAKCQVGITQLEAKLPNAQLLNAMAEKEQNSTRKGLIQILSISGIAIFAIVGVMVFSPLATQFGEGGALRGELSAAELDSILSMQDYLAALHWVDSCITENERDLPRYAYFDRFLSEEERYDVSLRRSELYDLQWTRINILKQMGEKEALVKDLEDYCGIIGYNQEQAKEMLNQMKGE